MVIYCWTRCTQLILYGYVQFTAQKLSRMKFVLMLSCFFFNQNIRVSVLDSPVVDPRSNPGSGSELLMSEKISGCILHLQLSYANRQALSSDKPNGHWFEADWLHCKRDALSSNRKVDGSRLTGSTQACHSRYGSKNTGDGISSARN